MRELGRKGWGKVCWGCGGNTTFWEFSVTRQQAARLVGRELSKTEPHRLSPHSRAKWRNCNQWGGITALEACWKSCSKVGEETRGAAAPKRCRREVGSEAGGALRTAGMPHSKQRRSGGTRGSVSLELFLLLRQAAKAARGGLAKGNVSRETFPEWIIAPLWWAVRGGKRPRLSGRRPPGLSPRAKWMRRAGVKGSQGEISLGVSLGETAGVQGERKSPRKNCCVAAEQPATPTRRGHDGLLGRK